MILLKDHMKCIHLDLIIVSKLGYDTTIKKIGTAYIKQCISGFITSAATFQSWRTTLRFDERSTIYTDKSYTMESKLRQFVCHVCR